MGNFTHLHVHTQFSLLDGAARISDLVARAKSMGQTSLAITDHGVMYGVVDFYRACKKADIKPIIGMRPMWPRVPCGIEKDRRIANMRT